MSSKWVNVRLVILHLIFSGLIIGSTYAQSSKSQIKNINLGSDIYWNRKQISVCWENAEVENNVERDWVKEAITKSWQKESQLQFTEWCPCSMIKKNTLQLIRIIIADDERGPRVLALGSELHGKKNGMVLNFKFKNWGTGLIPEAVSDRKTAIKAIAIHEFGHALGMSHQQLRDEKDCILCNSSNKRLQVQINAEIKATTYNNGLWYTPCDPHSVMNYCNGLYFNAGLLSDYDIETVRILYGNPTHSVTTSGLKIVYTASLINEPPKIRTIKQVQQNREYVVKSKLRWHNVNLYISGSSNEIANIDHVDYFLDPSFPNSNFTVSERNKFFKCSFYAWGNFLVKALIYFKDGTTIQKQVELDKIPPLLIIRKRRTLGGIISESFKVVTKGGN